MAKWSTYPKYKDSGVPWADSVPAHWEIKPAFVHCYEKSIKNEAGKVTNVLSLSYGRIVRRNVEEHFGLLPASFDTYQIVKPGDLILRLTDLQNDKRSLRVGYVTEKGIITSAYLCLVCKNGVDKKYAFYLLHAYDINKVFYGMGGGLRQTMKFDDLKRMPLFVPPLNEQQSIIDFLDHETAKIDHMIAKQERLIELLKEKRQAVISHAVTKGLNPGVPMKDSGVEWLGEVPVHWEVARLKHVAILQSGVAKGRNLSGAKTIQVPYLRVANVQDGYLDLDDVARIELQTEELTRYLLRDGDVLMNEGGDNDKLGRGAVWRNQISPCVHQNHVFAIRPQRVEPEWLTLVTRTHYAKFYFFRVSKQSTNLASISSTNIKETPLVVPPKKERREIMNYVDKMSDKYQRIQDLAEQQVALLKEHRTALISAAVTGKIDVRDWKKPEQQSQQTAKTATG